MVSASPPALFTFRHSQIANVTARMSDAVVVVSFISNAHMWAGKPCVCVLRGNADIYVFVASVRFGCVFGFVSGCVSEHLVSPKVMIRLCCLSLAVQVATESTFSQNSLSCL